jgi:hypothetical protein
MSQAKGFDMSKMSTADKIVLGAAAVYFIWVFIPVWYSCCSAFGVSLDAGGVSGFRGVLIISWILAIVAAAEVVLSRMLSVAMNLPMKRGQIHLGVAGLALLFTLLGLVAKTTGLTLSWGIFVGLIVAGVWTYGAYMMFSQPEEAPMGGSMGEGGGFTS